jgi:hypothetical protein
VPFLHLDQRPARERCLAALAKIEEVARVELRQLLASSRLVPGASPAGVADTLLELRMRGDAAACRRFVERAIPVRGAVRKRRLSVVEVAGLAAVILTWMIEPVLAVAVVAVALAAGIAWVVRRSAPARTMYGMERAAQHFAAVGDGAALAAIHESARQLIAEDRVPAGTGFWVVGVLRAATDADPVPIDLVGDLDRLRLLQPEIDHLYVDARRTIVRRLQLRERREDSPTPVPLAPEPAPAARSLRALLLERAPWRRWRRRRVAALRATLETPAPLEQTRRRVLSLYREIRDAAVRRTSGSRLENLAAAMRLTARWADEAGDAMLLRELRDDARALIARGRIPAGSVTSIADVLRDCVRADGFPMTLLDDYGALLAQAQDVGPCWSIVDAAILRTEARLRYIADAGSGGALAALREIAAAFEATAARATDPEIATRARKLAARAAALSSPSP